MKNPDNGYQSCCPDFYVNSLQSKAASPNGIHVRSEPSPFFSLLFCPGQFVHQFSQFGNLFILSGDLFILFSNLFVLFGNLFFQFHNFMGHGVAAPGDTVPVAVQPEGNTGINQVITVAKGTADAGHHFFIRTIECTDSRCRFTAVITHAGGGLQLIIRIKVHGVQGCQRSSAGQTFPHAVVQTVHLIVRVVELVIQIFSMPVALSFTFSSSAVMFSAAVLSFLM